MISTINHGLWKINELALSLERYNIRYPNGFDEKKARISKLMEDRNENLWLSSFQKGVVMAPHTNNDSFQHWELGIPSYIYKSGNGYVWCGTQDGNLYKLDNDGNILESRQEGAEIRCITEDSRNNLWIGIRGVNLYRINQKNGKRTFLKEIEGKLVTDIAESIDKKVFISVSGDGIWKYDPNDDRCEKLTSQNTGDIHFLRNSNVNKMLMDSKGRLWIGHYLGVDCYDSGSGKFLNIATDSLLNTSVCYALAEAQDGNILIGSNNGLYEWNEKDGTYTRYTTEDGLSSNMICGVCEDMEGNIWCSTFQGINSLNKHEQSVIRWYGYNGASKREYIRNCYHSDGRNIYFGDLSGITKFSTPVKTDISPIELKLTEVDIANRKIPAGSIDNVLLLDHNENTFTLGLSSMTFTESAIRIHYRLQGLDSQWNSTRYGINQITYNNIKPGKYILDAYSEENGQKSEVYSLNIRIRPPWFRSILAYILYSVIFIIISISLYIGYRRKEKERANNQKLQHYINLAHEIRTPMVMITNPIETLINIHKDPESSSALNTMKHNAHRIVRILDQFLEINRIDVGNIDIHRKNVDLVRIISDSLAYFTYQAKKRNISLVFEHAMDKMYFSIDPNHIDTIIYNLLSNSFKHTQEKGEIIVGLDIDDTDGSAIISVKDSGTGFNENNIKNIFKRFYQDPSEGHRSHGFGIGLNLCMMLVELHEGTITASNRKDRSGAKFTITIPNQTTSEEIQKEIKDNENIATEEAHTDETPENSADRKIKPKKSERILIVDDDDDIRMYLKERLSSIYRISMADNGDSGIQKALTEMPDLVISDISMPGSDGYSLLKKLKSNPNTTHIPVILLTAKSDLNDKISSLEQGADYYITKPFHLSELKSIIESLLLNRNRIRGKYSGAYQEDKIKEIELESDNEVLMKRVMKVINDNLDNTELKVEMLSKEIGLSRVQLHRRLKEITGISTGEFIRNIRMKKAAELLSEKKVNISQVAYMVGFSSHTHFSTVFRKFYGISPTEYINKES